MQLTLADLPQMARRDAQLVLREADRRDVVRSLGITEEMVAESTRRVCETMRGLASEGAITWPPAEAGTETVEPTIKPRLLELAARPTEDLAEGEIVELLRGLARRVADHDWVSCEDFAAAASGPFRGWGPA